MMSNEDTVEVTGMDDIPTPEENVDDATKSPRRAPRRKKDKKVRFTLDLSHEQHMYLKLFAVQNSVEASKVCRGLLYLLETDKVLQDRLLDELFAEENDDLLS